MFTILPRPRASMCLPAARHRRNTAVRFTSSTAAQSSSEKSTAGARRIMPALLTRMSIAPSSRTVASTSAVGGRGVAQVAAQHARRAARACGSRAAVVVGHVLVAVAGDVGAGLGERARDRRADAGARAGDQRGETVETKRIHEQGRPNRLLSARSEARIRLPKPGWTLTTPNWRSSTSRCAAIIQMKLMPWPGAATFGW